jgi:hypothetical protein
MVGHNISTCLQNDQPSFVNIHSIAYRWIIQMFFLCTNWYSWSFVYQIWMYFDFNKVVVFVS